MNTQTIQIQKDRRHLRFLQHATTDEFSYISHVTWSNPPGIPRNQHIGKYRISNPARALTLVDAIGRGESKKSESWTDLFISFCYLNFQLRLLSNPSMYIALRRKLSRPSPRAGRIVCGQCSRCRKELSDSSLKPLAAHRCFSQVETFESFSLCWRRKVSFQCWLGSAVGGEGRIGWGKFSQESTPAQRYYVL